MSDDLKPCPFCGGDATFAKTSRGWKVECFGRMGSCTMNARTHYQQHKFQAITAWNTRADRIEELEAKLAKAVEALREIKGQTTHCCGAEVAIIARIDKKEG